MENNGQASPNSQSLSSIPLSNSLLTTSLDHQPPQNNLKDLTMKFEIIDPDIYRKLRRVRQDQRNSHSGKVYDVRQAEDELTKSEEKLVRYPPPLPVQTKQFDEQEMKEPLVEMARIMVRLCYRTFLKNCMIMGIKRLEQSLHLAKSNLQPQPQWMYSKLFSKPSPTQQQQTFKQFLNHCATLIQCHWKRYITSKHHRLAMKRIHQIKAVVRGWKTRQIYNSNRIKSTRAIISSIHDTILECEVTPSLMVKVPYLYKELSLNVSLFNEQFEFIYRTGGWVFEKRLGVVAGEPNRIKAHSISISNYQTNYRTQASERQLPTSQIVVEEQPKPVPARRRNRDFGQERTKQTQQAKEDITANIKTEVSQIQNVSSMTQATSLDERPIKGTGVYALSTSDVLNEEEKPKPIKKPRKVEKVEKEKPKENIMAYNPSQNEFKNQQDSPKQILQEQKQEEIQNNKPKIPAVKRLVRKQKYDPRKAIAQEKKRKKQAAMMEKQVSEPVISDIPKQIQHDVQKSKNNQTKPKKVGKAITKKQSKDSKQPQQSESQQCLEISIRPSLTHHQKSYKKAQPKVNCWSRKPDAAKIQKQKYYYSQVTQDIHVVKTLEDNFDIQIQRERVRHSQPVIDIQPRVLEPVRVDFEEHFRDVQVGVRDIVPNEDKKRLNMERHQKFTKNLQRIIDQLEEKKEQRKKGYKSIEELMETYDSQYMNRFNRLAPKLEKLFFQRSQQEYPLVPIILHNSIFGQTVSSTLDSHSYRRIFAKLQKQYKNILESSQMQQ